MAGASFIGGAVAGASGSIVASPIQGIGNNLYFGDSYSLKAFGRDVLFGAIGGGVVGGATAYFKGNNIWYGDSVAKGRTAFSFNNTDRDIIKIIPGNYQMSLEQIEGEWRSFKNNEVALRKIYSKHGVDFGLTDNNYNIKNGGSEKLFKILKFHTLDRNTIQIPGFYRGTSVFHYYNSSIQVFG